MLRINDICQIYKISRATVYSHIKEGLEVIYIGERSPRFDENHVDAWLKEHNKKGGRIIKREKKERKETEKEKEKEAKSKRKR